MNTNEWSYIKFSQTKIIDKIDRCYDNEVEDKKKEVFDAYERDLKWGVHSWGIPDLD